MCLTEKQINLSVSIFSSCGSILNLLKFISGSNKIATHLLRRETSFICTIVSYFKSWKWFDLLMKQHCLQFACASFIPLLPSIASVFLLILSSNCCHYCSFNAFFLRFPFSFRCRARSIICDNFPIHHFNKCTLTEIKSNWQIVCSKTVLLF